MAAAVPSARAIVRIVLIIAGVLVCLYLIWQLRRPLSWIFVSAFLAIALSPPVNYLNRFVRRGLAILGVYLVLFGVLVALAFLLIPPIVNEVADLADNAPRYAADVRDYVDRNDTLRKLEDDYDIAQKLEDEAAKLPARAGGAAGTLRDIGFGIVNSLFAMITVLVLTAFMLSNGRTWTDRFIEHQHPDNAERIRRVLDHMAGAVSGYVAGALAISFINGILSFIVLTILGVPFAVPLAVVMGALSLIPLVGATIGAVLVGVVTVFSDFPTDTIVWTIWAIVYQQLENHLIQPQIQKRTVQVNPFIVIVSVLFGSTLLGILGAIVAIPAAASIQIVAREWWQYREAQGRVPGRIPTPGAQPGG